MARTDRSTPRAAFSIFNMHARGFVHHDRQGMEEAEHARAQSKALHQIELAPQRISDRGDVLALLHRRKFKGSRNIYLLPILYFVHSIPLSPHSWSPFLSMRKIQLVATPQQMAESNRLYVCQCNLSNHCLWNKEVDFKSDAPPHDRRPRLDKSSIQFVLL